MNENSLEPISAPVKDRSRFWFYIPFILAAVVAGILWIAVPRDSVSTVPATGSGKPDYRISLRKREVHIYFPDEAFGWTTEMRVLEGCVNEREEIGQCIHELISGPGRRSDRILPERLVLDDVYQDMRGIVYLDFHFPQEYFNVGGILSEQKAVDAILKTIESNFPRVQGIRILFNGETGDTFAGHIDISRPFELQQESGRIHENLESERG
ncbi:GerMN domain-containing protein [bacterium]|nr:GerMN domain-containing protein [candidate division CSSED10-310 bacterium]